MVPYTRLTAVGLDVEHLALVQRCEHHQGVRARHERLRITYTLNVFVTQSFGFGCSLAGPLAFIWHFHTWCMMLYPHIMSYQHPSLQVASCIAPYACTHDSHTAFNNVSWFLIPYISESTAEGHSTYALLLLFAQRK